MELGPKFRSNDSSAEFENGYSSLNWPPGERQFSLYDYIKNMLTL